MSSGMLHCVVGVIIPISKDCSAIAFRFNQSKKKYVCAESWVYYVSKCVSGGPIG
jgi:hypothetical protein